jgi:hypothetical protein
LLAVYATSTNIDMVSLQWKSGYNILKELEDIFREC